MIKNDYYYIACNDYRYLLCTLDSDFYNNMAVACQQICEKALKSVLVCVNPDAKKVINSHNLMQIYETIDEEELINLDVAKLALLNNYYFEARYPGDGFINVSKKAFERAYLIVIDVLNEVNKWRLRHNLEVEIPSASLKTKQALLSECSAEDVFSKYRQVYKVSVDDWEQELDRLSKLFNTTDKSVLASKIKETFL